MNMRHDDIDDDDTLKRTRANRLCPPRRLTVEYTSCRMMTEPGFEPRFLSVSKQVGPTLATGLQVNPIQIKTQLSTHKIVTIKHMPGKTTQ